MSAVSDILEEILSARSLDPGAAEDVMDRVMDGELDEAQIGGLLTALRAKGETAEEITGFARSMRAHARSFDLPDAYRPLVDTCGTGGDSAPTINISTVSALVAAGAGVRVAKHGNRSVSSRCGSADLLEALGVKLELTPEQVEESIKQTGIGFMYAPAFHRAMKHAIGPRKSLGVRTVFNLLGPLTNPAGADRQLLGVFSEEWVRPIAEALRDLGVHRALVVHGLDGLDEISLSDETVYAEVDDGDIEEGTLSPGDFDLEPISLDEIAGGGPETNREITRRLLRGDASRPVESIILANAGAVIYVADGASSLEEGVSRARESIHDGEADRVLDELVSFTRSFE